MKLDTADIEKLATLARISVDQNLIDDVSQKLGDVLTMIDELQAIDASGIAPMAHPLDSTQPLREDVVTEYDQSSELQKLAPAAADGLYLVPKVID